jgi:hypothetical protein
MKADQIIEQKREVERGFWSNQDSRSDGITHEVVIGLITIALAILWAISKIGVGG